MSSCEVDSEIIRQALTVSLNSTESLEILETAFSWGSWFALEMLFDLGS